MEQIVSQLILYPSAPNLDRFTFREGHKETSTQPLPVVTYFKWWWNFNGMFRTVISLYAVDHCLTILHIQLLRIMPS